MSLDRLRCFLERQAVRLHQESIVHRLREHFRFKGRFLFPDDKVKALNGRPLAMFFYNLRAVFLGCSLIFLIVLSLVSIIPSNADMRLAVAVLTFGWLADVALTLYFHNSFILNLGKWAQEQSTNELPPLFDRYFVLDSVIVFLLIVSGKIGNLSFDAFAFLLFANVVVYTAYFPTLRRLLLITIIFFVLAIIFLLGFAAGIPPLERRFFQSLLFAAPFLGMAFVIVVSVLMISRLRALEHESTIRRLDLLGTYGKKLAPPETPVEPPSCKVAEFINIKQFRNQLSDVLKEVCTLDDFWYRSACLWLVERHKDRGELLMPAAWHDFPEAEEQQQGISATTGLLAARNLLLVHSIKYQEGKWKAKPEDLRCELDAPAAFIPLRKEDRVGLLALYGQENGPPPQRQDEAFLTSLGLLISNSLEQWDSLYQIQPQKELDELFQCDRLDDVFHSTVTIMQEYLGAAGCMVIFRPNPDKKEMHIAAKTGFSDSIYKTVYEVGKGLTGKCAETGEVFRFDDVSRHGQRFDPKLFKALEQAHREEGGQPIISWMCIPIGTKKNYGVIKMVNRKLRSAWFTKKDEELGLSLALRLQVIIEKFLYIEEVKKESAEAKRQSDEAKRQLAQRQEDLMVTMHQLQGPMAAMLGSISYLKEQLMRREVLRILPWKVARTVEEQLSDLEDFVMDSKELSYGTFTSFALEAGRPARFEIRNIDAPKELKKLAERLQRTNSRADLTFKFHAEPGFPILRMDRRVFTSVLYSLIHNAMKYADLHSEVSLICATEGKEPVLKVKSVGEPILPADRATIFEKFGRGAVVSSTGRHGIGVGLGLWVARKLMRTIKGEGDITGDLTVETPSTNPRLSVFIVHIPQPKNVTQPAAQASSTSTAEVKR